jgi:alpha-N-arabinofuranosidase
MRNIGLHTGVYILGLTMILLVQVKTFAQKATLTIDVNNKGAKISPSLHGIFFEEISHGGEGGLYAELIQNRGFEENNIPPGCSLDSGWIIPPRTPHFSSNAVSDWKMKWEAIGQWPAWSLQTTGKAKAEVSLSSKQPLHAATPHSLQLDIKAADKAGSVSVVNDGFWGIRVDKGESYNLTYYIRTKKFSGPITASLKAEDGRTLASYTFDDVKSSSWKKYTCILKASDSDFNAKFYLSTNAPGTVWFDFVSLFPAKTFKSRPNGMRVDLANYLADLKPSFIRWPGGCFVEGISTESAPNWKRSLGPLTERPGTYSPWGYWSSDGIGYHEFLQFCEDIGADAMYVFNCGVSCEMRAGVYSPDERIPGIIADILDGIEYAIGPVSSKWGAVRAQNGHPEPFPLKYIEVGNEQVGERYAKRFNIFYKAIKEKYPQLEVMAAMGIAHLHKPTANAISKMDIADEHAYKGVYWPMIYHDWYDKYERKDWKLYVGEYACNSGVGSGNMMAALNDATFILGMERNADLITMSSYAPLLENINDTDWPVNLIRFDNAKSLARISYYTIKMMNENRASVNLKTDLQLAETEASKVPLYTGEIGLSTWDTYAEFKDVQVLQNDKVVYTSDFVNRRNEWKTEGGSWKVNDQALAQSTEGAWPMAILSDRSFDIYTLRLKARKTGGPNAFMIPIAIQDNNNYLRAHIGAWWNAVSAFEMVTNGTDAMVTQPVRLENPIETNRWYDIEIRVNQSSIECYLDGKQVMVYKEPRRFFSIAGLDEKTREVVVKVVNASKEEYTTRIELKGSNPVAIGRTITLSSEKPEDENTMEAPVKYIPVERNFTGYKSDFDYSFQPWSVTILRIKQSP